MSLKKLVLSTILVLMVLVLVGCGGGGGDKKSQPDTNTTYNPSYQLPEDNQECMSNPSDDRCQTGPEDFVDDLPARIEQGIQDAVQDATDAADHAEDAADQQVCGESWWTGCDTGD